VLKTKTKVDLRSQQIRNKSWSSWRCWSRSAEPPPTPNGYMPYPRFIVLKTTSSQI
jgi:hypothetical protein